jgi:fused signal recognition particle receptor
MFSFFKKKKEDSVKVEENQEQEAYADPVEIEDQEKIASEEIIEKTQNIEKEEPKEEKKGFFSRALEKTFASIKTVVPQKQKKLHLMILKSF